MRENLNAIIAKSEAMRGVAMPRIGTGHSEYSGGIFSLLQDPGGIVHTPRSGALISGFVDVDNDDPTANWTKALLLRLGIPKAAVTPWNAFGAYGEQPGVRAIQDNVPLCQELLDKASPIAAGRRYLDFHLHLPRLKRPPNIRGTREIEHQTKVMGNPQPVQRDRKRSRGREPKDGKTGTASQLAA